MRYNVRYNASVMKQGCIWQVLNLCVIIPELQNEADSEYVRCDARVMKQSYI